MTKKYKLAPGAEIEFATKEEEVWLRVIEGCEQRLKSYKDGIMIDEAMLELAKKKAKQASKSS